MTRFTFPEIFAGLLAECNEAERAKLFLIIDCWSSVADLDESEKRVREIVKVFSEVEMAAEEEILIFFEILFRHNDFVIVKFFEELSSEGINKLARVINIPLGKLRGVNSEEEKLFDSKLECLLNAASRRNSQVASRGND